MKKVLLTCSIIVMVVMSLVFIPTSVAQTPLTAAFAVQNQSTTDIAHVQVVFYNTDGTTAATDAQNLDPGGLGNFAIPGAITGSWVGSAVVSSDEPISAIVSETDNFVNPTVWGNHEGFTSDATGTNMYLPFILRNRSGRSSFFGVQNASSNVAQVWITYTGHSSSPTNKTVGPVTLEPGASEIRFQSTDDTDLGEGWMGSVTVTGTQNLAASVTDMGTNVLYNYSAVGSPSTHLLMPFVVGDRSNQDTAHAILNPGSLDASITITYTGDTQIVENYLLGAGEMWNLAHSSHTGSGFLGSAELTSSQPVLAIVNHTYGSFSGGGKKMSYTAISADAATDKIALPFVLRNRSSKMQGVIIQNAGDQTTSITVQFNATLGGTSQSYSQSVDSGGFWNFSPSWAGFAALEDGFYGTASITTNPPTDIVAIVNTWNYVVSAGQDSLGSYIGVNYASVP
jgi:hypothetical protein